MICGDEIVVDLFAGGGGASTGIEAALGRRVDVAINHDALALAVHAANHPETEHLEADVWEVRPKDATRGRPVGLLWASPDCTHFSVAKGGKPRKQNIRSLAWVVTRWAKEVRPRIIMLENVSEFRTWGPLAPNGQPDKARMGETFRRWLARLEKLGYSVEYRVLDASVYGAPTRRRRLFLIARRDGLPIAWPEPTHGRGLLPLRTAAECIDWSLACPSIFEREKALAEKTLWRIAQGIRRFVLENPKPFIVRYNGGDWRGQGMEEPLTTIDTSNRFGLVAPSIVKFRGDCQGTSAEEPLPTITSGAGSVRPAGAAHAMGVVVPHLVEMNHSSAPHGVDEPLGVVTTQHNRFNLVEPVLEEVEAGEDEADWAQKLRVLRAWHDCGAESEEDDDEVNPLARPELYHRLHQSEEGDHYLAEQDNFYWQNQPPASAIAPLVVGVGGRAGQSPATSGDAPLGTITAKNDRVVLAPHLVKVNHGGDDPRGEPIDAPLSTVTATRRGHALVAAHLSRQFGKGVGADPGDPLSTVMPGGSGKTALVSAFLAKHYGGVVGQQMELPTGTITSVDHHSLAAATLVKMRGECSGADPEEPMPTVTASGTHIAEVRAFLTAYYSQDGTVGQGQSLLEPMRTVTAKARLGLVVVEGHEYQIVDIGMRMLEPEELLRAQFGRFATAYDLSRARTKAGKVRLIGNSVPPEVAEAIVLVNTETTAKEMTA